MNRVYVIGQHIPNDDNSLDRPMRYTYFYNKHSPANDSPAWFSNNLQTTVTESPQSTIDHYIKGELGLNFYIQFIYD